LVLFRAREEKRLGSGGERCKRRGGGVGTKVRSIAEGGMLVSHPATGVTRLGLTDSNQATFGLGDGG